MSDNGGEMLNLAVGDSWPKRSRGAQAKLGDAVGPAEAIRDGSVRDVVRQLVSSR